MKRVIVIRSVIGTVFIMALFISFATGYSAGYDTGVRDAIRYMMQREEMNRLTRYVEFTYRGVLRPFRD